MRRAGTRARTAAERRILTHPDVAYAHGFGGRRRMTHERNMDLSIEVYGYVHVRVHLHIKQSTSNPKCYASWQSHRASNQEPM